MAISDHFIHDARVAKYTTAATSTAYGRKTFSYVESSTVYPCRLQSKGSGFRAVLGTENQATIYDCMIYLDIAVPVEEEDRLIISSTAYEVIAIRDAAGQGHHLEIEAKRIKP